MLNQKIQDNLNKMNLTAKPVTSNFLTDKAPEMGLASLDYQIDYPDGTTGLLVTWNESHNKYNNGVYALKQLADDKGHGAIVMDVIVPNTKSKSEIVQKLIDQMTARLDEFDTAGLDVYDFAEITGQVATNLVTIPLAKNLYPDDKLKQERFIMLYTSNFLSAAGMINAGIDVVYEETVNAQPYLLKMMIDRETAKHGLSEKDNQDLAKDIAKQLQNRLGKPKED